MTPAEHEEIYRTYSGMVKRQAFRVLRDEPQAEEVAQDVFLGFIIYSKKTEVKSISALLYRMATQRAIKRLIRRKGQGVPVQFVEEDTPTQERPGALDYSIMMERALANVTPLQAQIAFNYFVDGMSHAEIATLMEMSASTVGRHLEMFCQESRLKFDQTNFEQAAGGLVVQSAASKVGLK